MVSEINNIHNIELKNREELILKGVDKVKNINENLFIGKIGGYGIIVQGSNMELKKLDLDSKEVEIYGTIDSIRYTTSKEKFWKRIFK